MPSCLNSSNILLRFDLFHRLPERGVKGAVFRVFHFDDTAGLLPWDDEEDILFSFLTAVFRMLMDSDRNALNSSCTVSAAPLLTALQNWVHRVLCCPLPFHGARLKKGFKHIHIQAFLETPGPCEQVYGAFRSQKLGDKSRFIHCYGTRHNAPVIHPV